jgi:hypothetical protein
MDIVKRVPTAKNQLPEVQLPVPMINFSFMLQVRVLPSLAENLKSESMSRKGQPSVVSFVHVCCETISSG